MERYKLVCGRGRYGYGNDWRMYDNKNNFSLDYKPKDVDGKEGIVFSYVDIGKDPAWKGYNKELAKLDGTPIHIGSHRGKDNKEWCDLLFEFFKQACDPLTLGSAEKKDLLLYLARNLNPNLSGKWNETLLHVAAKYGRTEAMHILVERGANVDARTSVWGKTPGDYLNAFLEKKARGHKPTRKTQGKGKKSVSKVIAAAQNKTTKDVFLEKVHSMSTEK